MTKIYAADAATGQEGLRDMTESEKANYDKLQSDYDLSLAEKLKSESDKAALLDKLGITQDEAKLLLS